MPLWPHQERARQWVEDTLPTLNRRSVVVQLPTGGGKTEIARSLKLDYMIAPGADLARQLSQKLEIPVYLPQELARRVQHGQALPRGKRVGLDEARWIAAPKWGLAPMRLLEQGCELVMFDATPATPQGAGLGVWADALLQAESVRNLVDQGYLVPWDLVGPEQRQRDLWKDPVDAWFEHARGQTTIAFCEDKDSAAETMRSFTRRGVRAASISDESPPDFRRWLLGYSDERQGNLFCGGWHPGALETGAVQVAVCAEILRQGIDLWRVSAILLMRGITSLPLYLQALGRGGRPVPRHLRSQHRKTHCTAVDLRGVRGELGHPEDDRRWSLGPIAVERLPPRPEVQRFRLPEVSSLDNSQRLVLQCSSPGCESLLPYRGDDQAVRAGWGALWTADRRIWHCQDHYTPATAPARPQEPSPELPAAVLDLLVRGSAKQRAKLRATLDRLREVDPRLGEALTAGVLRAVPTIREPQIWAEWRSYSGSMVGSSTPMRINLLRHQPAKKRRNRAKKKLAPSPPE